MTANTPDGQTPETPPPAPPPPPPPPPPAWQRPAPPARSSGWKWGCGFGAAGCLLLVLIGFLIVYAIAVAGRSTTVRTTSTGAGPVLLIRIDGLIVAGEGSLSLLGGGQTGSDDVVRQIATAIDDDSIKAILLRVNSPGGSAAGSQEIYNAVARAKQHGKKVVVSMADVAASGGYYVSANADKIFADPATMTGSIGVIAQHEDLTGLLSKVGVKVDTIKSGQFKDMLSQTKSITPAERQLVQNMIMTIYQQFVTAVAQGRHMKESAVRKLADGRVYIGTQAKTLGLVDEIGGLHEALVEAGKMVGYTGRPTYREYGPPGFLRRIFGSTGMKSAAPRPAIGVSGGLLYDSRAARLVGQQILTPEQAAALMATAEQP